jgi:hypothetical protein
VIDIFERVLDHLGGWYPPNHFNGQDAESYFSDFIADRYRWYRAIREQRGPGSGGTITGVLAGAGALTDVEPQSAKWSKD